MKRSLSLTLGIAIVAIPGGLSAQSFPTNNPVLRQIWTEAHQNSQLVPLAQALLDSVGPRLTGAPGHRAGNEWAVAAFQRWGIPARNEQYGTWRSWRRGITHVDLLEPRVRTLEGTMLAWSPGTSGPVTADVVMLPESGFEAWLPSVRGKYVLLSFPQPTCRPDASWKEFALPASFEKMRQERAAGQEAWNRRLQATGLNARDLPRRLEEAGAVGILTSNWSAGWGVNKIFQARTERVPTLDLSCEDYGLVFRLTENRQNPVVRVNAQAEFLGERPVFNTIAEIRGTEKPNEYVMLSAHFDSWDAASGATDNGTGTVVMMEAMRILRKVYPRPKRTILVGLWGGEEQGLNGSRAFAADNPRVVSGLHALFNQDNGTGRVVNISMQGLTGAGNHFARWLGQIPTEITGHIQTDNAGVPAGGGSDHASFICAGAPAFSLSSLNWEYGTYTWHTNRDTFDKIAWDDVRNNATLVAMLTYLASEDPTRMPRDRRTAMTNARTGEAVTWPACQQPARTSGQSTR